MRNARTSGAGASEAILVLALASLVAVFVAPCVDDGFRPRYRAFDLEKPQACLLDPTNGGASPSGLMRWTGRRPLRFVPVPMHAGDLVKLNLSTPCESVEIGLDVDDVRVATLALTPSWHQWSIPLERPGARLSLRQDGGHQCAVDLSRVSVTNTRASSGPPFAAYVVAPGARTAGRPVARAALLLALLTLALGALSRWRRPREPGARPIGLWVLPMVAGCGPLIVAGIIDRFTAAQLVLRTATAALVLTAPVAAVIVVEALRRTVPVFVKFIAGFMERILGVEEHADPTLAALADTSRRRALVEVGIPLAVATVLLAALFRALLAAGPSIPLAPGDGWLQNLPARTLIGESLRSGRFPWWDPLIFSGFPTFADVQSAVLYPLTWVFAVLPPGPSLNVGIALSFMLAFLFTYHLARSWDVPPVGALWSGMAFAFSAFMLGNLGLTNMFHAVVWLPAALWAHRRFVRSGAWRDAAWCALALTAQFYAGHTQTSAYTILALSAAWIAVWYRRSGAGGRQRIALGAVVTATLFGLMVLPQVLATRELLVRSLRTGLSFHEFGLGTFTFSQLGGTVVPYLFEETKPGATWVTFLGIGSLALATIAVARRRRGDGALAWTGAATGGLFLAMGPKLPWVGTIFYHTPVLNAFRGSRRWMMLITLAVAVLAGKGLARLCEASGRGEGRSALRPAVVFLLIVAGLAGAVVVLGGLLGPSWAAARVSLLHPRGRIALLVIALYAAWCAWWALGRSRRIALAALGLLGAAELATFNAHAEWRLVLNRPDAFSHPVTAPLEPASEAVRNDLELSHQRALTLIPLQDWGVHDPQRLRDIFMPNVNLYRGIPNATGYSPLAARTYVEVTGIYPYGGSVDPDSQRRLLMQQHDLLDLLSVRWVVAAPALAYRLTATPPRTSAPLPGQDLFPGGPVIVDGVTADQTPWPPFVAARPAQTWSYTPDRPVSATSLVLVSATIGVPDGATVATVRLILADHTVLQRRLVTGHEVLDAFTDTGASPSRIASHAVVLRSDSALSVARLELAPSVPAQGRWTVRALALVGPDGTIGLTPSAVPISPVHDLVLERRDSALPHVWLARSAQQLSLADTVAWLRGETGAPRVDPATTVTLSDALSPSEARVRQAGEARELERVPDALVVRTESPEGGWLVVSESWSPNWAARIDGGPWRPVRRAYELIQAVEVPPGTHRTEFRYRPVAVWKSLPFAAVGYAAALLLLAVRRRPTVPSRDAATGN